MAKKVTAYMSSSGIESIVNGEGIATADRMPSPFGIHARAVTIVQHHDDHYGPHEPVYTESEVRAKDDDLRWALKWMSNEAAHLRDRGEAQPALEIAIDMVLKRHGITLDPVTK